MLGTLISYATGTSLTKGNVTKVALKNVKKGQIWVIKNSTGKILHEKKIQNNESFTQDFDFTSLKNGYYTLEVNKDFQIDVTPFTIISEEVLFHKKAKKIIFKPVMRIEENKILITKLNFEAASLSVLIYYENDLIFKDIAKGGDLLNRVYSLQKDKKGDYKVILKANNRTYINEFILK